jgi:hypothetical protein
MHSLGGEGWIDKDEGSSRSFLPNYRVHHLNSVLSRLDSNSSEGTHSTPSSWLLSCDLVAFLMHFSRSGGGPRLCACDRSEWRPLLPRTMKYLKRVRPHTSRRSQVSLLMSCGSGSSGDGFQRIRLCVHSSRTILSQQKATSNTLTLSSDTADHSGSY